jgi:hypothetical protein
MRPIVKRRSDCVSMLEVQRCDLADEISVLAAVRFHEPQRAGTAGDASAGTAVSRMHRSQVAGLGLQELMRIGVRRYEHIAAVIGVPCPNLIGELTAQLSFAKPGSRARLAICELTRR